MKGHYLLAAVLASFPMACGRPDAATSRHSSTPQCAETESGFALPHAATGELIRAEIKDLNAHAWAGEYYAGDHLGSNDIFLIAPASGFLYAHSGCLGVYGHNLGAVSEHDGVLDLQAAEREPEDNPRLRAPTRLHIVRWGARTYLIRPDELIDFCNVVNGGGEPRNRDGGFFLLRKGDHSKPANGQPALPEQYRALLLRQPINAKVVSVGASRSNRSGSHRETDVQLDIGRRDGTFVGMELRPTDLDAAMQEVRITEVGEITSKGICEEIYPDRNDPLIKPGTELSSRLPWADHLSGPMPPDKPH